MTDHVCGALRAYELPSARGPGSFFYVFLHFLFIVGKCTADTRPLFRRSRGFYSPSLESVIAAAEIECLYLNYNGITLPYDVPNYCVAKSRVRLLCKIRRTNNRIKLSTLLRALWPKHEHLL